MRLRPWTPWLAVAMATVLFALTPPRASAGAGSELLMFEEPGCPWCKRWHDEVGVAYPKTPEGQRAPLRRVELAQARHAKVKLLAPVIASPTFVLVQDDREVGRITGYPGAAFFWGLLGVLLQKVEPVRP